MRRAVPGEKAERLLGARYTGLPGYCGDETAPGHDEVEEWRDWTAIDTTPDQMRMEDFIGQFDLRRSTVWHVGVGNSRLATRFSPVTGRIIGTTISQAEKRHGDSLHLPNYQVFLSNKYSGIPVPFPGKFDFILDNNPSTFACCLDHLARMMAVYRDSLKDTGMIVTDRVGLGWVVSSPGANPRWSFDFDDWAALGEAFELRPARIDDHVYVLAGARASLKRGSFRRRLLRRLGRILGRGGR